MITRISIKEDEMAFDLVSYTRKPFRMSNDYKKKLIRTRYSTAVNDYQKRGIVALREKNVVLRVELARLQEKLHDEMSQLEIVTDLGNKRWMALNEIYENGEKHNANWCKRKAQEGLGMK